MKGGFDGHFHEILGRALADPDFQESITSNDLSRRADALKSVTGQDPTDEQLRALDEAVHALMHASDVFGEGLQAT